MRLILLNGIEKVKNSLKSGVKEIEDVLFELGDEIVFGEVGLSHTCQ